MNTTLNLIAVVFIFLMMVLISADVAGRAVFTKAVQGTFEFVQYMMVYMVFFALAYTQMVKGHVRVESVTRLFNPRRKLLIQTVGYLIALFFFGCMTYASWGAAMKSFIRGDIMPQIFYFDIGVPEYPTKFAVPIGAGLISLQILIDLVKDIPELIRGSKKPSKAAEGERSPGAAGGEPQW